MREKQILQKNIEREREREKHFCEEKLCKE